MYTHRTFFLLIIGGIFFVGGGIFFFGEQGDVTTQKKNIYIAFASTTVKAEVADTEALRVRGLSGHAPLLDNTGMWFEFDTPKRASIWMKEMLFPLDILWFDENLQLVYMKENATPESYPETFMPSSPALYVLEVQAGFVKKYGVLFGEKVAVQKVP